MTSRRVIILLMDSFGVGSSDDATQYHDEGANTFVHIAEHCAAGKADKPGLRKGVLHIPNLMRLGLGKAAELSMGEPLTCVSAAETLEAKYGYAEEISYGKDTPSGHWEIAGVPALFDWGYFSNQSPSFPAELISAFIERCQLPGILGNCHASGTEILKTLGQEHMATGKPIVYTSADSVFQIACHEETFGLERLYDICAIARELVDEYHIGRVIARPFVGEPGCFERTPNRRDYATPPPSPTLFNALVDAGGEVIAIGKTADIFAHQGISQTIKAAGNMALFDATLKALETAGDQTLIFTNFVDFDSHYGHRRDVVGYAAALEAFDLCLPELEQRLLPGDMVVITADHGCDPTWRGTDHTREHVPVLAFGPEVEPQSIGKRSTFADIGQSVASFLGLAPLAYGKSFVSVETSVHIPVE